MYSANLKCLKGKQCTEVCISPHCRDYPFKCDQECCLDKHTNHPTVSVYEYYQDLLGTQSWQTQVSEWYYMIDSILQRVQEQLSDLRKHHQDWYEKLKSKTFKCQVLKQKLLTSDIGYGDYSMFSGIEMFKLRSESTISQTKKIEPYNISSKVDIIETVGPTLERMASQLKAYARKLYDCKVEFIKTTLKRSVIESLDPQTDEITIINSTLQKQYTWKEVIESISRLKYLRRLQISECGINDQTVELISNKFPNLLQLDLKANKISRKGARNLAKLRRLQELNLAYNQIGDNAAINLVESLPDLQTLSLAVNNITSETQSEIRKKVGWAKDIYF